MAKTRFSEAAHARVSDIWRDLGETGVGRDRWKLVALVLAEALEKLDADHERFLQSEYSVSARTKTEQYIREAINGKP